MNQAKKINNLIDQLGLKQRRVAQKIGLHFTTMSRIPFSKLNGCVIFLQKSDY